MEVSQWAMYIYFWITEEDWEADTCKMKFMIIIAILFIYFLNLMQLQLPNKLMTIRYDILISQCKNGHTIYISSMPSFLSFASISPLIWFFIFIRGEQIAYPDKVPGVYLQWRLQRRYPIKFGILDVILGPRRSDIYTPQVQLQLQLPHPTQPPSLVSSILLIFLLW